MLLKRKYVLNFIFIYIFICIIYIWSFTRNYFDKVERMKHFLPKITKTLVLVNLAVNEFYNF